MLIHTFHQRSSLHCTLFHFTSLPFPSLHFTSHHFKSLHCTSLHFNSLPFPSPPFPSFHFTSLQITSLPFPSLHFTSHHFKSLHFTELHFPSLPFISLHITSLPFPSLHFTSHHFRSLHCTSLHFTAHFSLPWTFGRFVTTLHKPFHFSLLIINFLTLFLKIFYLEGKVASASAGSSFHSSIVLLTEPYLPMSVLYFLAVILDRDFYVITNNFLVNLLTIITTTLLQ